MTCPASFEAKRLSVGAAAAAIPDDVLQSAVAMGGGLTPPQGGGLTPPQWKLDLRHVSWPLLCVHACEFEQVVRAIGRAGVAAAATCSNALRCEGLAQARETLQHHGGPNKCFAVVACEAVADVLRSRVAKRKRVGSKSAPSHIPGQLGSDPKGRVRCGRCGQQVRRDNMARHQASKACAAGAAPPRVASSQGRKKGTSVTCMHCSSTYDLSQEARHLATRKCVEARGAKPTREEARPPPSEEA